MCTFAIVRWRSTPFVVMLSSTYSDCSTQFSSGLQAGTRGSRCRRSGGEPLRRKVGAWAAHSRADQADRFAARGARNGSPMRRNSTLFRARSLQML